MALFGFNKQKALSNAEKYVQQGKLQNAISEYEKVLKNDAKDLTVTNTVGDLYSRLGHPDNATTCFKTVGDAYASQGFTVKAIAMYKKICKLQPSLESLLKLAELYTQQGLFNDARAQYLQVAEEFLKAGELENAVRIFQKILEMDPENSNMRVRLAEVYVRLGKKPEAWQIFSAAAESLRSKGSLAAAEEVLRRMLTLDPGNTYALMMQGKNLLESGDAAAAVTALQKIADIDSSPDGLRDLLKAYLQTGQLSEAGAVANKLLTVHNDLAAISSFADALMQAGQYENALQVFDQHAERLLAQNSDKVLDCLHTIIGHVRENPASLQKLLDLFNKAGESTHVGEVVELLAHASVQAGDLPRARDLYQKLATIEPQNPLHMQNYQQVVSQLGGTSGDSKRITPEEAVVLIDDLEATAPSVHQHYSDEVALAVRSALTDAELFISYNMPAKALGPLMTALPLAPNDLRVNQRLAALHTRAGRFAEASLCCRTLQRVYSEAEFPEEATRYGELAERYEDRSSAPEPRAQSDDVPVILEASPVHSAQHAEAAVAEFSVDQASDESAVSETAETSSAPWPGAADAIEITVDADDEPGFAINTPAAESQPAEIDLSAEWDGAPATVEAEVPVQEAPAPAGAVQSVSHGPSEVDDTIEEIRFYLAHGMVEQGQAALAKLQNITGDRARLSEVEAEVQAALQAEHEARSSAAVEPVVEEISASDIPTIAVEADEVPVSGAHVDETLEPVAELAIVAPVSEVAAEIPVAAEAPAVEEIPVVAEAAVEAEPAAVAQEPADAQPASESAATPSVLTEFVSDLETSLGDTFLPGAVPSTAAHADPEVAAVHQTSTAATEQSAPELGAVVADIEASLGDDFLKAAPVPEAAAVAETVAEVPAPGEPQPSAPPLAASAAASASSGGHVAAVAAGVPVDQGQQVPPVPTAVASVPPVTASVAWTAPVIEHPAAPPVTIPSAPATAVAKASPFGDEVGVDLSVMFGELKQDLEAGATSANDDDPETHYNLGIAFREMGLLDEAIGELQKACQCFDHGHAFSQIMQTYTWLAQCFLEKGVPEAAVRWYEKALGVTGIDGETRVALHYELASAHESSGNKPAALHHFMDVYGANIDYRDVAERIKALKS